MKPAVIRLYVVLVILTLVGLAAWAGADWYQHRQSASTQTQKVLRQAAGAISDLTLRPGAYEPGALGSIFGRFTPADPGWKVVVLSSPERGTEFYRGPRPAVPADRAVPRWTPRPWSEILISLPVFRAGADPLVLEGIREFYGRAEIFSLLKACGITLVILLTLTGAMVLLSMRRTVDAPPEEPWASVEEEPEADPWAEEPGKGETEFGSLPDLDLPEPQENQTADEEYWFDESLTLEDLPPLEAPASAAPLEEPSLFSPTSGLGWQSFLETRLEQELDRAAGGNQDLSLILFGTKSGSPEPAAWGRALRGAFPSIDLNFEYEGGAAVVLPGRSLDQALKAARAFLETVDAQWPELTVHAGAASRSGRLVPAATLLAEAVSARRRTLAGSARVLGLKTDADRWRDHLASAS